MVETERIDTAVIEVIKLKQRTEGERAMNLTIEIPDDNAARYRRVAQARGLTVERWMLELADNAATPALSESPTAKPLQTATDDLSAAVRRLSTFGKRHGLSLGGMTIKELLRESRP